MLQGFGDANQARTRKSEDTQVRSSYELHAASWISRTLEQLEQDTGATFEVDDGRYGN